jgi:hypothetical protein
MLAVGDKVQIVDFMEQKHVGKIGKIFLINIALAGTQPIGENGKFATPNEVPRYNVELNEGTKLHFLTEQQLRKVTSDITEVIDFDESLTAHLSGARLGHDNSEIIHEVAIRLVHFILINCGLEPTEKEENQLVSESIAMISINYEAKIRGTFTTKEAARTTILDEIERLKIKYSLN